jgi:ElaB/YqjD/DUF883 family membrane-anchored ribosome-binding protein
MSWRRMCWLAPRLLVHPTNCCPANIETPRLRLPEVRIRRWTGASLSIRLVDFTLVEEETSQLEGTIMDEHQNPEEAVQSGQDHLRTTVGDLKEAAGAKVEDIRQAAGQKVDELRGAAQGKAQELRSAAESTWSDARSQAKSWQAEGEAYVRKNPTKAVLIALGVGLLSGLLLRK